MSWLTSRAMVEAQFDFMSGRNGLIGWIRKGLPKALVATLLTDLEGLMEDPSSETIKVAPKGKVIRRSLSAGNGGRWDLVVKQCHYKSFWRRIGCLFVPSEAFQSLTGSILLEKERIDTAESLAVFEFRRWRNLGKSYYITAEVKPSQSIDGFWVDTIAPRARRETLRQRGAVLRSVAKLFYRLHSRGIYHRDLKGANILVRQRERNQWQCLLIDVAGLSKSTRVSWPRRVKNLEQLVRTFGRHLTSRELAYLIKRYSDLSALPPHRRRSLAARLLAMISASGRKESVPETRSGQ